MILITWWCDHCPRVWSQVGFIGNTMSKASRGDRIPAGLFQILIDDTVKVLHSIY